MPQLEKDIFEKVTDLTAYNGTLEQRVSELENTIKSLFTIPNPWKPIYKDVQVPQYKHYGDAGQDIRAYLNIDPAAYKWYENTFGNFWCEIFADAQFKALERGELPEVDVLPGETLAIPTGLSMEINQGYECQIRSRSGLASKRVIVANAPGTIDSGYTRNDPNLNELVILLHNQGDNPFRVQHGDRIAQAVFSRVVTVSSCVDGFCPMPSNFRSSGLGSSGVK